MLIIDTETGGLNPETDALLSVAAIHVESGAEILIMIAPAPGLQLTEEALKVNGLDPELLAKEGMPEKEAIGLLSMWLGIFGKQEWAGCNPEFDRGFIDAAFTRSGLKNRLPRRPIDVQTVAWTAYAAGLLDLPKNPHTGLPTRSLDGILKALGLARSSEKHDALEDAQLTLQALTAILNLIKQA
jgi:ribonuclease T